MDKDKGFNLHVVFMLPDEDKVYSRGETFIGTDLLDCITQFIDKYPYATFIVAHKIEVRVREIK